MLTEMCNFIDIYAEYILKDVKHETFSKEWPKDPKLRGLFFIDEILNVESKKNVLFIFYNGEKKSFKILEKKELEGELPSEFRDYLSPFINNPAVSGNFYNDPTKNKSLGGKAGINSFFPFIFNITGKIKDTPSIKKKIKKTANALKKYNSPEFMKLFEDENFSNDLINFIKSDFESYLDKIKNERDNFGENSEEYRNLDRKLKSDVYVFIFLPNITSYENFLGSDALLDISITRNNKDRKCQICGTTETKVGYPVVGNSYDQKKEFLTSPTKGKNRINVCSTCGFKVNAFDKVLNTSRVLPIFINYDEIKKKFPDIRSYLRYGEKYSEFMSRIYESFGNNEYKMAHYLFLKTKGTIWVDYVSSLKWKINWEKIDRNTNKRKGKLTTKNEEKNRMEIEYLFYKSMIDSNIGSSDKPFYHLYFGKVDLKENSDLVYRFRDLLYRFTYKGEVAFRKNEIIEFVNSAIERKYYFTLKNNQSPKVFLDKILDPLEIFLNIDVLTGDSMKKLDELHKKIEELCANKSVSLDDEEWAYCAGAFYRYLITHAKSKEERLELEPIINTATTGGIVDILSRTFEKYQHAIKLTSIEKSSKIAVAALTQIDKNRKFEDLKPYFYAGFVDSPLKNVGEQNE